MNSNVRAATPREFSLAVERMRRTLRRAGLKSETCTLVCASYRHALTVASDDAWSKFYLAMAGLRSYRPLTMQQNAAFTKAMLVLEDGFEINS